MALRTLGDPEEAADALQDAMISAFRRAGGFPRRLGRDHLAAPDRGQRLPGPAAPPGRPAGDQRRGRATWTRWRRRPQPDPSADSDIALDVLAALRTLPPDQQAALVLVDMLGYSVADAAEILGVSPGTVKSRCARGRARLLPQLAHLRNQPGVPRVSPPAEGAGEDQS